MSADALTAARVYRQLKASIIDGHFVPGTLLVVSSIAEDIGTSISPVRDALHRLVGERLIDIHTGGGFDIPVLTGVELRDLYRWHGEIIRLALRSSCFPSSRKGVPCNIEEIEPQDPVAVARATAAVFTLIAERSENAEYRAAISSAGERLHAARIREARIGNRILELQLVQSLTLSGQVSPLRQAIFAYHRRRLRRIDTLTEETGVYRAAYRKP